MTTQQIDIYDRITNAIIEKMEEGYIPWAKDWSISGIPKNRVTGRAYSGINFLILSMSPYQCGQWLTFKQARAMGGSVKKGEKGTGIIFYKKINKQKFNDEESTYFVLKGYTVFNVEQCDGVEVIAPNTEPFCGPLAYVHHVETMKTRHNIVVEYGNPAYNTSRDVVKLPKIDEFTSEIAYCQAANHEFVHWSGNSSRHDRFKSFDEKLSTHNELYAAEELVAELGAAMLCANIGINSINTHAAYIQGWLKALKNNKKYIFKAAAKAKKAADFLMNIDPDRDLGQ